MIGQFETDKLTVGAVSMNAELGERDRNLEVIAQFAREAVGKGAALVATPECSVCAHAPGVESKQAAEPLEGPSFRFLHDLCGELQCVVSAGIAEESGGEWPYNTQILVGPDGLISRQRKLHLSGNENCFFHWGHAIEHAEIGRWRIGAIICYDNLFQELHRILALRGCELILCPHAARCGTPDRNLTEVRDGAAPSNIRIHAQASCSNACFELFVNQVGVAGPGSSKLNGGWGVHAGGIYFTGPNGELLAQHQEKEAVPELVTCTLNREDICKIRRTFRSPIGFRRVGLFGELADPELQRAFRQRYGRPRALPDFEAEGFQPYWQVDYPR